MIDATAMPTSTPPTSAAGQAWLLDALTSPFSLWLIAIGLLTLAALVVLAHGMTLLPRLPRRSFWLDHTGTATVEFALVTPIALFLALVLGQTTLAMGGNIFVHYSAYAATRAAIVQIPRHLLDDDEPTDVVDLDYGQKIERIREAAALALLPVAGRSDAGSEVDAQAYVAGLTAFYAAHGQAQPRWVERLAADRYRYVLEHTEVTLLLTQSREDERVTFTPLERGVHTFGLREPITVRVDHDLNLALPYVWRLFADSGDSRTALVTAGFTLINAGIDRELPPRPRQPPDFSAVLERNPQ